MDNSEFAELIDKVNACLADFAQFKLNTIEIERGLDELVSDQQRLRSELDKIADELNKLKQYNLYPIIVNYLVKARDMLMQADGMVIGSGQSNKRWKWFVANRYSFVRYSVHRILDISLDEWEDLESIFNPRHSISYELVPLEDFLDILEELPPKDHRLKPIIKRLAMRVNPDDE